MWEHQHRTLGAEQSGGDLLGILQGGFGGRPINEDTED